MVYVFPLASSHFPSGSRLLLLASQPVCLHSHRQSFHVSQTQQAEEITLIGSLSYPEKPPLPDVAGDGGGVCVWGGVALGRVLPALRVCRVSGIGGVLAFQVPGYTVILKTDKNPFSLAWKI